MNYSLEQQTIINAAKEGNNIICNAVAGAGKTTTLLGIAKALPNALIIQITYNRKLKQEVREKVSLANISNMEVSNYHALSLHYYGCHTDNYIIDVGKGRITACKTLTKLFTVCIIDEAQDMTPEYYDFVRVFVKDYCVPNVQLIILGDEMQSVYDFKLASPSYLVSADHYWPEKKFIRLSMSQSFRITPEISSVINSLAGREIIHSGKSKSGISVTLISSYNSGCHPELKTLIDEIKSGSFKGEDLMIILPSSDAGYATSFINRLASARIPVYKQSDITESTNEKYAKGKVLVCTFHTSKGLERDTVIIFNFDTSYYSIYQPEKLVEELIPTLYVGMTRAIKRLYLVENGERLPYLNNKTLSLMNIPKSRGKCKPLEAYTRDVFDVRKLIKFLPSQLLYDINVDLENLFVETIPVGKSLSIPKDIRGLYGKQEFIADLTSIATLDYFEHKRTGKCKSMQIIEHFSGNMHISQDRIEEEMDSIENSEYTTELGKFLHIANLAEVCRTGHLYRYKQIEEYDWVTDEKLEVLMKRLDTHCPMGKLRALFGKEINTSIGKRSIIGEIYLFSSTHVYEPYLAKEIDVSRLLSAVFHVWILENFVPGLKDMKFEIHNLLTDQMFQLKMDMTVISRICNRIISWKF